MKSDVNWCCAVNANAHVSADTGTEMGEGCPDYILSSNIRLMQLVSNNDVKESTKQRNERRNERRNKGRQGHYAAWRQNGQTVDGKAFRDKIR